MIHYIGYGDRQLNTDPAIYPRVHYELLVLFEGKCGLIKTDHPVDMDESSIWLMAKGSHHGWQGDGGCCRLLSVMLDHVEGKLADVVNSRGGLRIAACQHQRQHFDQLAARLSDHKGDYWAMHHLCKVVLGEIGLLFSPLLQERVPADWRVDQALAWFDHHMHHGPSCDDIASRGCWLSSAHLRRLFNNAGMAPMLDRLDERRLARATSMLTEGQWNTEYIARQCGWGSASALTHAMRRRYGCTVRQWLAKHNATVT